MFGDLGIDEFLTVGLKLAQRAFLVGAHQPAITGNVASEYRRQSAIHSVFGHGYCPGAHLQVVKDSTEQR